MQFQGLGKPAAGIVFDSDMGESIDTALALAMLYGFQGKNAARVISISVSKPNLKAAQFCDAVARFYAGEPGPFSPPITIGMADSGPAPDDTSMLLAVAAKFPGKVQRRIDTADPVTLMRNALTAQYDQNASVVLAGPATNLAGCWIWTAPRTDHTKSETAGDRRGATGSRSGGGETREGEVAHANRDGRRSIGRGAAVSGRVHREGLCVVAGAPDCGGVSGVQAHAL